MLPESKPSSTKIFAKYSYCLPTPHQKAILDLFWEGRRPFEIARILGINPVDIQRDLRPVYYHWGVSNVGEALAIAIQEGYLDIYRKDLE